MKTTLWAAGAIAVAAAFVSGVTREAVRPWMQHAHGVWVDKREEKKEGTKNPAGFVTWEAK